jgi:hypothetical protein
MAGDRRPSFLKRQKEQSRLAKAAKKREAKEARKQAKIEGAPDPDIVDLDSLLYGSEEGEETEGEAVEESPAEPVDEQKPETAG